MARYAILQILAFIIILACFMSQKSNLDYPLLVKDLSFSLCGSLCGWSENSGLNNLLPNSYYTFNAAIRLKSRVKLIPSVPDRSGALVLNQKYRSKSFCIDYIFMINSSQKASDGLIFWYLHQFPVFEQKANRIHGVSYDTNGLGVMLYKYGDHKWRLFAHYDRGGNPDQYIENVTPANENSCTLVLNPTEQPVKIRIEKIKKKIAAFVTDDSVGSTNWRKCFEFSSEFLDYEGYVAFTSSNQGQVVNDIDILAVMVEDLDPRSTYLADDYSGAQIQYIDLSGTNIKNPKVAKDILHREDIKLGGKNDQDFSKVISLQESDDSEELLYKIYKTLRIYNLNLSGMIKTLRDYEKEEESLKTDLINDPELPKLVDDINKSKSSIDVIGNSVVNINDTLTFLVDQIDMSKSSMTKDERDYTDRLITNINLLNQRLNSIESKMVNFIDKSSSTINMIEEKTNKAREDAGKVVIDTLNSQLKHVEENNGSDVPWLTVFLIIICILILVYLVNRKLEAQQKKHIL